MIMANKNQKLSTHLIRVSEISERIIKEIGLNLNQSDLNIDQISKLAKLAGLFHDLGKVDPVFQKYLHDKTTTSFNPNGIHIEKANFSFEDHPRHNEISWFILEELFDKKTLGLNKINYRILKNAVLWHHSSPIRKEAFETSKIKSAINKDKPTFDKNLKILLSEIWDEVGKGSVEDVMEQVEEDLEQLLDSESKKLPHYKEFFTEEKEREIEQIKTDIKCESIASLIRSVITTADRYVSAGGEMFNADEIMLNIFEENKYSELLSSIKKMEETFYPETDRSFVQKNAAIELSEISDQGQIAILNAPAGAGKTKVALQWIKSSNANKVYYIVPRTIIAEEVFDELKKVYLKKNVSFEIITGDKKIKWSGKNEVLLEDESECYKSDIIITTIDQLVKSTTTHKNISILQDLLQSHVIFDEFHEYYKMSGMDLLFAEIIKLKSFFNNPKTMLMSATPNYFMLESFLEIKSSNNIVSFNTINERDFNLKYFIYDEDTAIPASESLFEKFDEYDYKKNNGLELPLMIQNPFLKTWDNKKTIVISNTATMAQMSYILNYENENAILAHSKYKQEDKKDILSNIKNNFKKVDEGCSILRAGPIVQASLNITSERLVTDLSSPEKVIQRLGRLNRFNDDFEGEFVIAVPYQALESLGEKNKTPKSNVLSLLQKNDEKESCLLWLSYLLKCFGKEENGSLFKLKDIYSLYRKFYEDEDVIAVMEMELLSSLSKSYKNIKKNILNPMEVIGISNGSKNKEKVMSKNSLRGKSYNAKMAIYRLNKGVLSVTDSYSENVSLSRELMLLYNENYYFVKESVKKQDILYKGTGVIDKKAKSLLKKAKKEKSDKYNAFVLDMARTENFNIFTSLSKEDLQKFNKQRNDLESYIYIKTDEQVVGYLKLKQVSK